MPQAGTPDFFAGAHDAMAREQERQAALVIDTQIKILSATFDKSTAYTNFIVLAGYAGFFGLWQVTKEYFTNPKFALWAALLMLLSVVTFVFFEVVKMILIQHNMIDRLKALKRPEVQRDPIALQRALEDLGRVHERVLVHFMRFWAIALLVTIASGMAAAAILLCAFVIGISR